MSTEDTFAVVEDCAAQLGDDVERIKEILGMAPTEWCDRCDPLVHRIDPTLTSPFRVQA